jgi:hypothetical protein
MSPLSPEEIQKSYQAALQARLDKGKSTKLHQLEDYWRETVHLEMDRISVLAFIDAGILALKHPDYTGLDALVLRRNLGRLTGLVCEYVPREILEEWDRVLGTMFCS